MKSSLLLQILCLVGPVSIFAENDPLSFSFSARATGLDDSTPLEFILITPDSGHDYESIAVSDVSAEHILEGIRGLGAIPGHPADVRKLRFWPKGEWLDIEVSFDRGGERITVPIGELVTNTDSGTTLGQENWTFCGSTVMPDENGNPVLAADKREPGSILSVYNDPETLIDRAVQAAKGNVYGTLIVNTNLQLLEGKELTVSIRRKSATNTFQARDILVTAQNKHGQLHYRVQASEDTDAYVSADFGTLDDQLKKIERLYPNILLTFIPGPELSLDQVQLLYNLKMEMDRQHGYRFNAPTPPHFFFQSFYPAPAFRDPANRPSQPWELHIDMTSGTSNLSAVRYTVEERDQQGKPTLHKETVEITSPDNLKQTLTLGRYDPPVLLVFTQPSLCYGTLIEILRPIRESFDTYYFYFNE